MEVHTEFCDNIILSFKSELEKYSEECQSVLTVINQMLQDQTNIAANCPPSQKPMVEQHQQEISQHLQHCLENQRQGVQDLSNKRILDALQGHYSLEDNCEIQESKMDFRQLLINRILATPEFKPSNDVLEAMDDFLVDDQAIYDGWIPFHPLPFDDGTAQSEIMTDNFHDGWSSFIPTDENIEYSTFDDNESDYNSENSD